MAQRTQIVLDDDLDGGKADETVRFSVDGVNYEIDLSTKNAKKMRDTFATYVASARRVGGRRSTAGGRRSRSRGTGRGSSAQIREWARSNGYEVSDRGRISAEIRAAYAAAKR